MPLGHPEGVWLENLPGSPCSADKGESSFLSFSPSFFLCAILLILSSYPQASISVTKIQLEHILLVQEALFGCLLFSDLPTCPRHFTSAPFHVILTPCILTCCFAFAAHLLALLVFEGICLVMLRDLQPDTGILKPLVRIILFYKIDLFVCFESQSSGEKGRDRDREIFSNH